MATAFVKSASGTGVYAASVTAVFGSNVTAGNLIVVAVSWSYSTLGDFTGISDSLGNTYTLIQTVSDLTNGAFLRTYYAKNIAGGACTITCTFGGGSSDQAVHAHEVSGADTTAPLDGNAGQNQANPGTGANAVTSGAFTPGNNGCYIFGHATDFSFGSPAITQGTGYTSRLSTSTANNTQRSEDQVQATAASIAATFTISVDSLTISTVGAAFKPAAAGGAAISVAETLSFAEALD